MAARHQSDLIFCRKLPGITIGKLCDKCDGRCPICDSHIWPSEQVRICDECAHTAGYSFAAKSGIDTLATETAHSSASSSFTTAKCIICGGGKAIHDAFYCKECVLCERDRDGCPRIVNVGKARLDWVFERKKAVGGGASTMTALESSLGE